MVRSVAIFPALAVLLLIAQNACAFTALSSSHMGYRALQRGKHSSPHKLQQRKHMYCLMSVNRDSPTYIEMRKHLEAKDFKSAFNVFKKNPLLQIAQDDARELLNNISRLDPTNDDQQKSLQQTIDASVLIYRRLARQKLLKGFDCVNNAYPDNSIEVSPAQLEEKTGLPMAALAPKQRATYWRIAGLIFCVLEFWFGDAIGVDPVFTLIPATIILFLSDQLFYRGAAFETIYRTLFPEYAKKIVCHEAGHFLVAYLLGIPVRGCVTNAWDASRNPEIFGQAGTIFYDAKMADEMQQQQVKRSSLDRLSVVTMAGIAAEALQFGVSEGGIADEQSLVNLLGRSISPPWSLMRIQGQARWAALQAIKLIQEHQDAYDAVVKALEEGKAVGDVVLAIEINLPAELPSTVRIREREERLKKSEKGSLLNYVKKMTWNVGGITSDDAFTTATAIAPTAVATDVGGESDGADDSLREQQQIMDEKTEAVAKFAERIKFLETAVKRGDLNADDVVRNTEKNRTDATLDKGGIWLNNLQALNEKDDAGAVDISSSSGISGSSKAMEQQQVKIPAPRQGYEKAVEELAAAEGRVPLSDIASDAIDSSEAGRNTEESNKSTADFARTSGGRESSSSNSMDTLKPSNKAFAAVSGLEMLRSNRGYQMKQLELIEATKLQEKVDAEKRLVELRK